jgi:hypothetical protein
LYLLFDLQRLKIKVRELVTAIDKLSSIFLLPTA